MDLEYSLLLVSRRSDALGSHFWVVKMKKVDTRLKLLCLLEEKDSIQRAIGCPVWSRKCKMMSPEVLPKQLSKSAHPSVFPPTPIRAMEKKSWTCSVVPDIANSSFCSVHIRVLKSNAYGETMRQSKVNSSPSTLNVRGPG